MSRPEIVEEKPKPSTSSSRAGERYPCPGCNHYRRWTPTSDGKGLTCTGCKFTMPLGEAPHPISRQRFWQLKKQQRGDCRICGKPRPGSLTNLCRDCQDHVNSARKQLRNEEQSSS